MNKIVKHLKIKMQLLIFWKFKLNPSQSLIPKRGHSIKKTTIWIHLSSNQTKLMSLKNKNRFNMKKIIKEKSKINKEEKNKRNLLKRPSNM